MAKKDLPAPPFEKEHIVKNFRRTYWPTVSIVTPSYNQSQYLEATINSVLGQEYPNIEYWVMDGGSTDDSINIINKYSTMINGWVSEPDRGQAHAINKGWKKSTGKYLCWINSDDILVPNSLFHLVNLLEENQDFGMAFGDLELINENGDIIEERQYDDFELKKNLSQLRWVPQPGSLIAHSILDKVGYLNEKYKFAMDFDLWLRVGLQSDIGYVRTPTAQFRIHDSSKTSTLMGLAAEEVLDIYYNFFEKDNLDKAFTDIKSQTLANANLYAANKYIYSGQTSRSIEHLIQSLREKPTEFFSRKFWLECIKLLFLILGLGPNSSLYLLAQKIKEKNLATCQFRNSSVSTGGNGDG